MAARLKPKGKKRSRKDRVSLKHKDNLRCEWCSRWFAVPHKQWKDNRGTDYIFYCKRDRCVAGRGGLELASRLYVVQERFDPDAER